MRDEVGPADLQGVHHAGHIAGLGLLVEAALGFGRQPEPPKVGTPAPQGRTRVIVRLRSGEELEAGTFADAAAARARAKELVDAVQTEDVWLFVAGRSLNPEEIDTISLAKS